jgi:hypothetical protein
MNQLTRKIRSLLGHYRFTREVQRLKVKREVVSLEKAERIGVLYDATEEGDYEIVKAYVKSFRTQTKKDILAMGYVDKKQLPQSQFAQFGLDFFSRKDLNYQMIPVDPIVQNFIKEKFDILIDLSSGKCFPLLYIAATSNARFRVGRYHRNHLNCYDMMIKLHGETPIKQVIEETEHLLRQIKNNESE